MMIIGCDFHPSFQQIAYVDQETGEYGERRLSHREEGGGILPVIGGQGGAHRDGSNGERSLVPQADE